MKFERLRLSGFKSFVEPTEIAVKPGLTGIVGPNGCGKSNLLEALRWVMGEAASKRMRAGGMDDVIFGGTNTRPARNHAEVSLILDNHDRGAPREYNDDDSVEVTRHITRDAGSSYRINGRDVRARDVQLLFADAATGARSSALVQQGQVNELINARPQDRRQILEDAAGIAGLHSRRHESELKLRAADQNLTHADASLEQLDIQLRQLKRAARLAARYKSISQTIRKTQALSLYLRWEDTNRSCAAAETALETARQQVVVATRNNTETAAALTAAQAALSPLRETEIEAGAALRRLMNESESHAQEIERARNMLARAESMLVTLAHDQAREGANLDDAQAQLTRLGEEEAAFSEHALRQDQVTESTARTTLVAAQEVLAQAESRQDDLSRQTAEARANAAALKAAHDDAIQNLEKLEAQMHALIDQITTHQKSDNHSEAAAQLDVDIDRLTNAYEAVRKTAEAAAATVHTATQKRDASLIPHETALAALERLRGEARALQAMLISNGDEFAPILDALNVRTGYETALAAALGDDLTASLDADAPNFWRDLPPLESPSTLPESAIPLNTLVDAPAAMARRLSQIGLIADDEGDRLQLHLQAGQRLVSQNGALWRWDGYRARADAPTAAAQRLTQRNRFETVQSALQKAETHCADAAKIRDDSQKDLEHAQQTAAQSRTAFVQIDGDRTAKKDARAALAQAQNEYHAQTQTLENTLSRLKADIDAAIKTRDHHVQSLTRLDDNATLADALDAQRDVVSKARDQTAAAQAQLESIAARTQARTARHAQIIEEKTAWEKRANDARQRLAELKARAQQTQAEHAEAEALPASLGARRDALASLITDAQAAHQKASDARITIETSQRDAETTARATQEQLTITREAQARQSALVENAHAQRKEAEQSITNSFQIAADALIELIDDDAHQAAPHREDVDATLAKLKRERETLGGVNLQASEEASAVEEQIAALARERDDLTQAIAKLRQAISQLNREARARLQAAFVEINGHFQNLFGELFGGGSATLELIDAEDPLAAGLEIRAHPPGKKPQLMSLLSGGEQALTAIALIFSVFLTNPSPICVLDEVDAPLDDANVERFCTILRKIADASETRFLLITHHALTMARMDWLYGVTMQEQGVSHLLAVDLTSAEQFSGGDKAENFRVKNAMKSPSLP